MEKTVVIFKIHRSIKHGTTSSAPHNDHRSSGPCNGKQINSPRIFTPSSPKKYQNGLTKKNKITIFFTN